MPKHYFNRLEYMDMLIRKKATGNPIQLAQKVGICERTVYEYIDLLKSLGGPIAFDKQRGTYYYKHPGKFCFSFIGEE